MIRLATWTALSLAGLTAIPRGGADPNRPPQRRGTDP